MAVVVKVLVTDGPRGEQWVHVYPVHGAMPRDLYVCGPEPLAVDRSAILYHHYIRVGGPTSMRYQYWRDYRMTFDPNGAIR